MTHVHADLLVLGASAAGLKCAARFRRLRPNASIVVLDASTDISVGACGLPYVVSGDIDDPDALRKTAFDILRDEAFFKSYKDIDVRTATRANGLDTSARRVRATSLVDGSEQEYSYGDLMIAVGAAPKIPRGIAVGSKRVRVIKSMDDARVIRRHLETGKLETVGVIGAGFIGCEMAEAFGSMWGCSVTLLEAANQVLPGMLDTDMAAVVESELRSKSVDVRLGCCIARVEEGDGVTIHATDGGRVDVDMAVVAVGVAPSSALASEAGIAVGDLGGIVVDEHMRTSAEHVYAAGDCVQCRSAVTGKPMLAALGSLANRQGRVAADHMTGKTSRFAVVTGSVVVKVFDLNASATGMTHAESVRRGMDVHCVWGTFGDRAHYYPEEQRVFAKMVTERGTGKLVGLQVLSRGDVTRLVDVFSSVLSRGGTVGELIELEFAYAPPFASALDPLHHLAAMAMAQDEDGIEALGPSEDLGDRWCVDIRTGEEANAAPCPGATLHVPMGELRERISEIPQGDGVVACEKGPRSLEVVRWLGAKGSGSLRYLAGGRSFRDKDLG
jgi:NADPH-dependent 2,4-dienoyl-CoA reductase/sulfur reductase-like enzyme